jgi:hypothetical protein
MDMAWEAVEEQLEVASDCADRYMASTRIKAHIQSDLADLDLSVETIARSCYMSGQNRSSCFRLRSGWICFWIHLDAAALRGELARSEPSASLDERRQIRAWGSEFATEG